MPCSRCAKRHLECQYTSNQPSSQSRRLRLIRPAKFASTSTDTAGSSLASTSASSLAVNVSEKKYRSNGLVTGTQLPDLARWSGVSDLQNFDLPCSAYPAFLNPPDCSGRAFDDAGGPAHGSGFDTLSPSWFQDLDLSSALGAFYETGSYVSTSLLTTPDLSCTGALQPQFSQRTRSIQQGSLTTKMLFSKLADYTKMMGEGITLPPFIHPPCCLGQSDQCTPNSPHQCLPEILAVCANLTQMFNARVSGSHGYIWQQICTHLRQLRAEVRPELMRPGLLSLQC
jgi:hypothetical protein